MTTATDIRTLAVETDTRLAELDEEYGRLAADGDRSANAIHRYAGDKQDESFVRRQRVWTWRRDFADVLAACQTGEGVDPWDVRPAAEQAAKHAGIVAKIKANRAEAGSLEAIHDQHGWSRFFLVLNNNGHLHSDMSSYRCSRTATTAHGWNPALSGATEAEAVAELGPLLCTVCFPTAPVEWTVGKEKPAKCAGSGQYVKYTGPRYRTVYVECPECHTNQVRTPHGYVRAHKPA